jgi:hypothetical protein
MAPALYEQGLVIGTGSIPPQRAANRALDAGVRRLDKLRGAARRRGISSRETFDRDLPASALTRDPPRRDLSALVLGIEGPNRMSASAVSRSIGRAGYA